jgi:phage major head subunit gpT-like protein
MNSAFFPDPVSSANQQLGANPLKGIMKVVSVPYLANATNWFIMDTKRVIKALLLQMRKEFEFDALEMNTETGFLRDKYYYGVRARYNVGFGEWRCCFGAHVS